MKTLTLAIALSVTLMGAIGCSYLHPTRSPSAQQVLDDDDLTAKYNKLESKLRSDAADVTDLITEANKACRIKHGDKFSIQPTQMLTLTCAETPKQAQTPAQPPVPAPSAPTPAGR